MNQSLKHFSEMKDRDPKKKSNISTEFCKEFQFLISISRFCSFDELIEFKLHYWLFKKIDLASHVNFCRFAGIWAFLYVRSVEILLIIKLHGFVAFFLVSANVV